MLKKAFMLFAIVSLTSLMACSHADKDVKANKKTHYSTSINKESQKETNKNEEQKVENKQYQNEVFKWVAVGVVGDNVVVTGKAQVFEGVFQYAVMNGENVIQEDKYLTDGAPAWGDFTIIFKKNLVATGEAKIQLFVYSAKDGSKINILEIPINSLK